MTPDYTLGCKRILPSNRWYPALQQPNVELVAERPARGRRARSVVDGTGVEREVDTIIFGTGFHVTDPPVAEKVRGRDGRLLSEVWGGSPRAYLGSAVPGFPNLFLLLGPNTGLRPQLDGLHDRVAGRARAGRDQASQEPLAPPRSRCIRNAYELFNRRVDTRMEGTVWDSGCASFYLDETGRNGTLWPDWTWRFRRVATRFDEADYELTLLPQSVTTR